MYSRIFCLHCQKKVKCGNAKEVNKNTSKRRITLLKGNCPTCKHKICKIIG